MIGRTLRTVLAVLLLAGMTTLPAQGKNLCGPLKNNTKGCKNEIKKCVTEECVGLTGKAKRTCKKTCKTDTVAACKLSSAACASPSGAFVFVQ